MSITSFLGGDAEAVMQAFHRSQAIISFKPDGTIIDANENFCNAVGYLRADIVGKHHRIFVAPAEANSPEYAAFWTRLAAGTFDRGQYKRIGRTATRSGSRRPTIPSCAAAR